MTREEKDKVAREQIGNLREALRKASEWSAGLRIFVEPGPRDQQDVDRRVAFELARSGEAAARSLHASETDAARRTAAALRALDAGEAALREARAHFAAAASELTSRELAVRTEGSA